MAMWTGGSLREGHRIRNNQGGDKRLSKVVELNGNYRLFFKTFIEEVEVRDEDGNLVETVQEPNIRAAVVPGRTGDWEVVGTGFIPYTNNMYDVDEITQKLSDKTPLKDWARIARVLFEAQCAQAKKNAEAEAQRSASEMGRPVDVVGLSKKLDEIEVQYHGGKDATGKNINPDKSPAISSSIVFKISTRVLVVRMNADDTPDWKNAQYAVYEVSKSRTEKLISLLDNKKYFRGAYLEVGYSYIGSSTKEAGKNADFQAIVKSESLEELFPEQWAAIGKSKVEGIATGSADDQVAFMRSRNSSFKGGTTPSDIINTYKKWCSTNESVFGSIDFSDESTANAATLFLENHLVDSMPNQLKEFQRLVEERRGEGGNDEAPETTDVVDGSTETPVTPVTPAQSVEPVIDEAATAAAMAAFGSGATESQTLRQVAAHSDGINISSGDDDLGDL